MRFSLGTELGVLIEPFTGTMDRSASESRDETMMFASPCLEPDQITAQGSEARHGVSAS